MSEPSPAFDREALGREIVYCLEVSQITGSMANAQVASMILTGLDDQFRGWDKPRVLPTREQIAEAVLPVIDQMADNADEIADAVMALLTGSAT